MTITTDRRGQPVQAARPAITQNITIGAASVQSAAFAVASQPFGGMASPFQQNTQHVRLVSTTNCWVSFGASPTAAMGSNSIYLPANTPEYFYVNPGEKVAVIQDTAAGTLNIAELAN